MHGSFLGAPIDSKRIRKDCTLLAKKRIVARIFEPLPILHAALIDTGIAG
jgi:hypothetical protein